MLDVAWPELIVIGAVALVAIGPKDLPKVMRALGQWAGKARTMMHDIHRSFDQLNYEAEIAEKLRKSEMPARGTSSESNPEKENVSDVSSTAKHPPPKTSEADTPSTTNQP